jgi:small conductance mechanosensitive channel
MSRWLILLVFVPGILIGPRLSQAQAPATQPTTQTTTQATATPPRSLVDAFSGTGFGRVIRGEETLSWNEVLSFQFWQDNIKDLIVTLLTFIPRLIGTLLFLFVFWLIYRGIRKMANRGMKKGEVDSSIRDLLGALIKWAVMGFGIVIACNQLGIPIVAMLTGVSIIGLAVGFAAQETLANFIAGIVIFLDKPLRVGDWVEADGTFGQVRRVTFRSTRLLTMDGEVVVIPNTQLLSSKLVNHSTNPINRVNIPIGIAYKASIDDARRTLLALTATDNRIVKQPAPEVVVKECADSSVNLLLRFWIEDEAIERKIGYEYIEKAKKALDAANIEIPFPHMQLFVESTPAVEALARPRAA